MAQLWNQVYLFPKSHVFLKATYYVSNEDGVERIRSDFMLVHMMHSNG